MCDRVRQVRVAFICLYTKSTYAQDIETLTLSLSVHFSDDPVDRTYVRINLSIT
jgi:hypothetical protein